VLFAARRCQSKRAGVPTELAERLKALERENRELRQANEILHKASVRPFSLGPVALGPNFPRRNSTASSSDDQLH
jgi:transposase-like protein